MYRVVRLMQFLIDLPRCIGQDEPRNDRRMGTATRMNRQTFQNPGGGEGNTPAISEAGCQALVEMVGQDEPAVLVDLLDTYLVESAGLVNTIREGALSGDLASVLRPAHSLKSSSASIGALRLSKLCADLEAFLRGNLPGLDVNAQVHEIDNEFMRVQSALSDEKAKLLG